MSVYVQDYEIQEPWTELGSLNTVVTTPAVGARDAAAIETLANIVVWAIPQGIPTLRFRFRTTIANNSTGVIDLLTVRQTRDEVDYYNRACTVTVTAGQQVADSGYTFCDTVVVSNVGTNNEVKAVSPTGDYVGELLMNTEGISKIAFVPTTLTGAKILDIDVAYGYSRFDLTDPTDGLTDTELRASEVPVSLTGPTKTTTIDVVDDWQAVTAATVVVGTAKDISAAYGESLLYIETALVEAVAHGTGAQVNVEVSYGDDNWVLYTTFRGTAETAATTTINDASADAGDSTITLADATTGDFDVKMRKWFIKEATYANSESVKTISNATHVVTLAQDLIRSHTNGASCYDRVDEFIVVLPEAASYVRTIVNNDDADCDVAFTSRVSMTTAK